MYLNGWQVEATTLSTLAKEGSMNLSRKLNQHLDAI